LYKFFYIIITIVSFLFFACNSGKKENTVSKETTTYNVDSARKSDSIQVINSKKKFVPYNLTDGYLVIDTGYYAAGSLEGYYAIVKRNSKIDTIELTTGIIPISQTKYFYLKLTRYVNPLEKQSWPGTLLAHPYHYIITFNKKSLLLDSVIKGFDTYKSVPNVINGKIYFWQYKKNDGVYNVYAAEYDPLTGSIKSNYLFSNKAVDEEHIATPYKSNNSIKFSWENRSWNFSNEFKLIK
jgi:hypothetical protein